MKGVFQTNFFKLTTTMKNLLKVSALFFAVALASCESKPATEETTTTETSTVETTVPATDSTAMGTDSTATMATDSTTTTTTTAQ